MDSSQRVVVRAVCSVYPMVTVFSIGPRRGVKVRSLTRSPVRGLWCGLLAVSPVRESAH